MKNFTFIPNTASSYDLRYTQNRDDFENSTAWDLLKEITSDDVIAGNFTPVEAGNNVSFSISHALFEDNSVYFLAMHSMDKNNLISETSNLFEVCMQWLYNIVNFEALTNIIYFHKGHPCYLVNGMNRAYWQINNENIQVDFTDEYFFHT